MGRKISSGGNNDCAASRKRPIKRPSSTAKPDAMENPKKNSPHAIADVRGKFGGAIQFAEGRRYLGRRGDVLEPKKELPLLRRSELHRPSQIAIDSAPMLAARSRLPSSPSTRPSPGSKAARRSLTTAQLRNAERRELLLRLPCQSTPRLAVAKSTDVPPCFSAKSCADFLSRNADSVPLSSTYQALSANSLLPLVRS